MFQKYCFFTLFVQCNWDVSGYFERYPTDTDVSLEDSSRGTVLFDFEYSVKVFCRTVLHCS